MVDAYPACVSCMGKGSPPFCIPGQRAAAWTPDQGLVFWVHVPIPCEAGDKVRADKEERGPRTREQTAPTKIVRGHSGGSNSPSSVIFAYWSTPFSSTILLSQVSNCGEPSPLTLAAFAVADAAPAAAPAPAALTAAPAPAACPAMAAAMKMQAKSPTPPPFRCTEPAFSQPLRCGAQTSSSSASAAILPTSDGACMAANNVVVGSLSV